ncbi:MAG TPA: DUF2332 domain-containing protein [Burkholderiaceae bacterium]|jgi:hypothetical protein
MGDAVALFRQQFERFADFECTEDPLYVALCRAIAGQASVLALLQNAPATQARPNILLAALHERVLSGSSHALAAYYPSVGGTRLPDAELPAALLDFVQQHEPVLIEHLRHRSTQTNEIGRCAVLWPALSAVARQSGRSELALFDFGSSAGLNLGVDAYRYDYGGFQLGAAEGPLMRCRWSGAAPPSTDWRIAERLGVDPAAIDVQDEEAVRWLRACLWPHDRERAARLEAAVALACQSGWRVQRSESGLDVLEQWLDQLPEGVQPVLFNSWVLSYFSPAQFKQHRERVAALVHDRHLIEINAELPSLAPVGTQIPSAPPVDDPQSPTLWTMHSRTAIQSLAWSHGHGRWCHWLE